MMRFKQQTLHTDKEKLDVLVGIVRKFIKTDNENDYYERLGAIIDMEAFIQKLDEWDRSNRLRHDNDEYDYGHNVKHTTEEGL